MMRQLKAGAVELQGGNLIPDSMAACAIDSTACGAIMRAVARLAVDEEDQMDLLNALLGE